MPASLAVLAGGHPNGAVETDDLAVEVLVVDDGGGQAGVVLGRAQAVGVRDRGGQAVADVGAQAGQHRGVHRAGGDRVDPDPPAGQVAGGDDGEAADAGLGGGVGGLADLALERGDRGGQHDRAALAVGQVVAAHPGGGQPQDVVGAGQVDPEHLVEGVERARVALLVDDPQPVAAAAGAVHDRAQGTVRLGRVEGGGDAVGGGDVGRHERRGDRE